MEYRFLSSLKKKKSIGGLTMTERRGESDCLKG